MLSYRVNAVYLIAAAFIFIAPLSSATNLPGVEMLKWVRVYLTVLVFVAAVLTRRELIAGPVARIMLLGFVVLFIAPLWSGVPVQATLFRGIFIATLYSGVLMALSNTSREETMSATRLFLLPAAGFALLTLMAFALDPLAISKVGRLTVFGMNPNRIGQTCAPLLILCAYLALHDRVKAVKILSYSIGAFLAVVIILTGSRGAVGQAGIGCVIVAMPLVRHPGRLAVVALVLGATAYWVSGLIQPSDATDRIGEFNFDSREEPWTLAADMVAEKPLLGHGWVFSTAQREGGSEINLHSMYLQMLANTGVVGFLVFATAIFVCAFKSLAILVQVQFRWRDDPDPTVFLALAAVVSSLAWGVIDSGPVMGSTVNCLMLGYGAALMDRAQLFMDQRDWYARMTANDQASSGMAA